MLVQSVTEEKAKEIIASALDKASEFLAKDKAEIAEILVKQILRCDPEHLGAMQILGLCKCRMDRYVEAIEIFETTIDLDPSNADNYNNLALAYSALEHREKATKALETALEIDPTNPLFYNNIALNHRALGKLPEAIACLNKAIEMSPNSPQFYSNLAGIYGEMKDVKKSIECFEKALSIEPNYVGAHVDAAIAYCLDGQWERGFAEHEWRFDYFVQMTPYLTVYDQDKRWNGVDSLQGKRVLVYMEQGTGDQIQFSRLLPKLKEQGAVVIAHCGSVLEPLIKQLPCVDETTTVDIMGNPNVKLPNYDYQVPIVSLPHILRIYEFTGEPYIKVDGKNRPEELKTEYPNKLKIGLSWAGNPAHTHDKLRSIPLSVFGPLFEVPNVQFFDLQFDKTTRVYGNGVKSNSPDLKPVNFQKGSEDLLEQMVDLTKLSTNFLETAEYLTGLDLVICCDTALAHLAGSMGVPCWVLLPYCPDWRWGLDGEKTFWYDSLRLFRQDETRDWSIVVENIRKALHETVLQNQ